MDLKKLWSRVETLVEKTTLTSTYCGENPQNRLWYGSAAFLLIC